MADLATGRWKRPRPEHAEGTAQPFKDPSDEEDHLPQTSKRQATSAAATPAKTSTSCETLDGLAERLGSFHESARALANCLQKHDVLRKTDQGMIEAAKCMFHKIAGRGEGRLGSSDATVTSRSLYRDQTQQTTMFAYREIESESLSSLRVIERQICTSCANRNTIAAIFGQYTGASYRG